MEENSRFSVREKEIIRLVVQAKCRKRIAGELNISIHTIDAHLRNIHIKTGTHSLPELIIWAINHPC
jgi:DNA-binding CsgD family transcriptional regulator